MLTMRSMPQVVIRRLQGLATGGGFQMEAPTDLAVAARSEGF
ncbi:MAG: hypothetical protein ABI034_10550 [Nakamurella sp.]